MSLQFAQSPAEQLLLWMSEVGTGSWRRFKDSHDWVFHDRQEENVPKPASVAQHMLERGHAEFDWQAQRWAIAPTVLATVPGLPSAGLVVGGRTRATLKTWQELDWVDVYLDLNEEPDVPPPFKGALASRDGIRSVFVIADHVERLQDAATAMDAALVWDAGPAIADRLPSMTKSIVGAPRLPPPPDARVDVFVPESVRWERAAGAVSPGFYRFRPTRLPHTEFRLVTEQGALKVDRSIGIYAALAKSRVDALWYEPADVNGALHVRAGAPLPALQGRVLHLCSGLRPDESALRGAGPTLRYHNVPQSVAHAVADSLSQSLGSVTA